MTRPLLDFRSTCEQERNIHGYGWDQFDARTGGIQTIHDEGNKLDITTAFVKIPGGNHGGSWAVRVTGTPRENAPDDLKTMVYYYIGQDGDGKLEVKGKGSKFGFEDDVTLEGKSKALGDYKLVVTKGEGHHPAGEHKLSETRRGDTTLVCTQDLDEDKVWQAKVVVSQRLHEAASYVKASFTAEEPPEPWQVFRIRHRPGKGNSHVVQKTFQGGFEFDVIYSSDSAGKALTSEDVSDEIARMSESFDDRFGRIFRLKAPFTADKYKKFAKSMFSNLLGGVGYFFGDQVVDRSYAVEYEEENDNFWEEAQEAKGRQKHDFEGPYELFTAVPSRPFFPRGFLWDEGFHLLPIADWDTDMALEIISSWYSTMDRDGWIPREQILGNEARSKVPEEFRVQYPHYANPPTLFLAVDDFLSRLMESNGSRAAGRQSLSTESGLYRAHVDNPELGEDYLRRLYPLLRRQYDWFRKTQRGDIKSYDREAFSPKEAYRWRGRTETHALPSGLDDYPRPQPPSPGELHVDLMSWVGFMAKSLHRLAGALGMGSEQSELRGHLTAIRRNLEDLHWSEAEGCYCDATIDEFEENKLVCHKGYLSLFPFITGLLEADDAKVGKMLDLIGDEDELWSEHGIRSLSRRDAFYGTAENYWRGPVWMPVNYLVLSQLDVGAAALYPYPVLSFFSFSVLSYLFLCLCFFHGSLPLSTPLPMLSSSSFFSSFILFLSFLRRPLPERARQDETTHPGEGWGTGSRWDSSFCVFLFLFFGLAGWLTFSLSLSFSATYRKLPGKRVLTVSGHATST